MTKVYGLTGGIGSGKSTVLRMFEDLGAACYEADQRAKHLMNTDENIISSVRDLFGSSAYLTDNGTLQLNRKLLAEKVFTDPVLLGKLNSIVHPKVHEDFTSWKIAQEKSIVLYEAAILFKSNHYKEFSGVILVTAPQETRVSRVVQRDSISRKDVLKRMQNQIPETKKAELSNYVIQNTDVSLTRQYVYRLYDFLLNK